VKLHTQQTVHLMRDTMRHVEQSLDPVKFRRVHRSYIVNLDKIQNIQPASHGDYHIVLRDKTKLPLSRRYRERIFDGENY
jgi:two-component system LytT family response regulator